MQTVEKKRSWWKLVRSPSNKNFYNRVPVLFNGISYPEWVIKRSKWNPPSSEKKVIPESLRLHSTIPTQTVAKMVRYQKFQPKNAVSRTGAILFDIATGDQKYMDISSAVLHVECQIRDSRSEVIPLMKARDGGGEEFHPLGKVLPVRA